MVKIVSFKDKLDASKLSIADPVKSEDKTRVMDVRYDGGSLFFKTPRVRLNKETGELYFNIENKPLFAEFLVHLEDTLCEGVSSESKRLFGGKVFSREKVKERVDRFWDIGDSTVSVLRPVVFNRDTVRCFDVFGGTVGFGDLNKHVSAILEVRGLKFCKNLFSIELGIVNLKMSRFEGRDENLFRPPEPESEVCDEPPAEPEEDPIQPTLEEDTGDFFVD